MRSVQWFQDPSSYARSSHDNARQRARRLRFRQLLSVAFGLKPAPAWASIVSAELVPVESTINATCDVAHHRADYAAVDAASVAAHCPAGEPAEPPASFITVPIALWRADGIAFRGTKPRAERTPA